MCHECEIFIGAEGQNRLGDHSLCCAGGLQTGEGKWNKFPIVGQIPHFFLAKILKLPFLTQKVKNLDGFVEKIRETWSGLHTIQSGDQHHSHLPRNPFDGFCITGKMIGSLWTG